MAYVLYPTAAGKKCPIMSVEALPGSGVAIRFDYGRVDYFLTSDKPGVKLQSFAGDGKAIYVRTGGKATEVLMAGGTGIARSGKRVEADIAAVKDLSETNEWHKF